VEVRWQQLVMGLKIQQRKKDALLKNNLLLLQQLLVY
jgi:hypothetical protein